MQFVLGADVGAHADDKDVAEAGGGRNDPNEDPQHDVGQQVLEGRDAVRVGLTAADVRSVAAVLELLKITGKRDKRGRFKSRRESATLYNYRQIFKG